MLTSENVLRDINEADLAIFQENRTVEDIIVRCCFVTTMERGLQIQASGPGVFLIPCH